MTSQFVSGPGIRDNYLKVKEPAYRYHYYGVADSSTQKSVKSDFNIDLNYGSSITLDMHKTWMVAIENFNGTLLNTNKVDITSPLSLVLSGIGQPTERSNVRDFDGTSIVFNFIAPFQQTVVITDEYIGHRITNPNFLNMSIPCSIYVTNGVVPDLISNTKNKYTLNSLQFTLVIYEYDP
jgi:hypothetical protein